MDNDLSKMANTRISMSKIRQILRMYTHGRSKLSVATHTGVSRNTVKNYLKAFSSSGCSFEQIDALNDKELDDFFGKSRERTPNIRLITLQRCFPSIDRELKRTGVTRATLWEAYEKEFSNGFHYTQFCFYYNQWKCRVNPVMHLDHKAGDKLFIDFAGQKLSIVDKDSGEVIEVEVFVAILAASQLTYVEAVMSQQKEDFISACEISIITAFHSVL